MDTNVLISLERRCQMKQRILNGICSKELRAQAIKLVADEWLFQGGGEAAVAAAL